MDSTTRKNDRDFDGSTSRSLIVRLQENDLPAWQELVELYSPLIVFWCRKFGLAEQDCGDVTQDVFRSVVSNIKSFQKQNESDTFRGWLRTVTHSKVVDFFRRNQNRVSAIGGSEAHRRLSQTPDDDDFLVRDEDELREEHALFLRAIAQIRDDFTDRTWNAFWEVVINGLNATEAGNKLGMKSGAVRVAKSRVLKRLRLQLGDDLDHDQVSS